MMAIWEGPLLQCDSLLWSLYNISKTLIKSEHTTFIRAADWCAAYNTLTAFPISHNLSTLPGDPLIKPLQMDTVLFKNITMLEVQEGRGSVKKTPETKKKQTRTKHDKNNTKAGDGVAF